MKIVSLHLFNDQFLALGPSFKHVRVLYKIVVGYISYGFVIVILRRYVCLLTHSLVSKPLLIGHAFHYSMSIQTFISCLSEYFVCNILKIDFSLGGPCLLDSSGLLLVLDVFLFSDVF